MVRLSICVPQYKEDESIARFLFDSIEMQQGIDFSDIEVVVVNDGTDVRLSDAFFGKYSYKVRYECSEHAGVSETRNKCMDLARGEYVMFCDIDDMFYSVSAINIIFEEMDKSKFDVLSCAFAEEQRLKDGHTKFLCHAKDATFVHGKVYRKQFLVDNELRWDKELTVHEDSYFNCLCRNMGGNVFETTMPLYLWKYRSDSVCRRDSEFIYKTYDKMVLSNERLVGEFVRRKRVSQSEFYATSFIYMTYYLLQKKEWWEEKNRQYRENVLRRFAIYWDKFQDLLLNCDDAVKARAMKETYCAKVDEGLDKIRQSFDEFIKEVEQYAEA